MIGKAALILSAALFAASQSVTATADPLPPAPSCPPALLAAARDELVVLRAEQERIRLSTAAAPEGLQQVQEFDRAAHACHLAQGQSSRDYGEPVFRTARDDGRIPVRYPYLLHHRQAGSVSALFAAPWKSGPGGALEVEFELRDGSWVPGARRELLDVNQGGDE